MNNPLTPVAGRVIGTEDATPLEFWVAIAPGQYLQLDDVVALERRLPNRKQIKVYGLVTQVRARHEGARFDSDVFLISEGLLPAEVSEAAQVLATRFEPEVFVPPLPGQEVRRARDKEREQALFFDRMEKKLAVGLSRDGEPVFINYEFLDGTRGAHVNISGVSGVATKTSYATFLLYSLYHSDLESNRLNTKALIFNLKGEDLLYLDKVNRKVADSKALQRKYKDLGLPAGAFTSTEFWAPPRRGAQSATPDVASRQEGITSFFWTLSDFCRQDLLMFLFADSEDDRQQYTIVIHNVMAQLRKAVPLADGGVRIDGGQIRTFRDLADLIADKVQDEIDGRLWAGRAIGQGTTNAFIRRLFGAVKHVQHLIRADVANPERHRIKREHQITVVDIHNLNDRAQRFVVGVTLKKALDEKERSGSPDPRWFVVLDELNKYAPREGSSPIKEIILDIAERGRSLGFILIGAQQTASEVERRVTANSAIRVVGRLDSGESARADYSWLPTAHRQRSTIIKPGTMILSQPELPIPLVLEFPFPAWATRPDEALPADENDPAADPFQGLVENEE